MHEDNFHEEEDLSSSKDGYDIDWILEKLEGIDHGGEEALKCAREMWEKE